MSDSIFKNVLRAAFGIEKPAAGNESYDAALDPINASPFPQPGGGGASALTAGSVGTTQIASKAVTNAKLADVATQTIKGRTTAGTGVPEDLTAAQALAVIGAQAAGAAAGGDLTGTYPNPTLAVGRAKIKVGNYTGDGSASRAFTGVGFRPFLVIIVQRDTNNMWVNAGGSGQTVRGMGVYSPSTVAENTGNNVFASMDADGFTLGTSTGQANANTKVFDYMAVGV